MVAIYLQLMLNKNAKRLLINTLRCLAIIPSDLLLTVFAVILGSLLGNIFMDSGTKQEIAKYGYSESTVVAHFLIFNVISFLFIMFVMFFVSRVILPFYKNIISVITLILYYYALFSFEHLYISLAIYLTVVIIFSIINERKEKSKI